MLRSKENQIVKQGDTVIFGFRIQAFVTRGYVVPISGINSEKPKVECVWFADGREIDWPKWS